MELIPIKTKYRFIIRWVVATFGAFLLSLLFIEIGEKSDIGLLQATIGGLAIALPQAVILRFAISPLLWVWTTVVGWVLITGIGVGAVGWIVPPIQFPVRILYGVLSGGISGLVIGLVQWLAIRYYVPCAWQWILVSTLSWAVAIPIGSTVGIFLHQITHLFLGEVIGLAVTWLVVSFLTGINARRLLIK